MFMLCQPIYVYIVYVCTVCSASEIPPMFLGVNPFATQQMQMPSAKYLSPGSFLNTGEQCCNCMY